LKSVIFAGATGLCLFLTAISYGFLLDNLSKFEIAAVRMTR